MFNSAPQRVMDDLRRKGDDMDRISDLSLDLQNMLNVRTEAAAVTGSWSTQPATVTFFSLSCRSMRAMLTDTAAHWRRME